MNKYELAIEIEQYFLGSILLDGSLMEETNLTPEHFIEAPNRELFRTMQELRKAGEEVNLINLTRLGTSKTKVFGGRKKLSQLAAAVPSVSAFKKYEKSIIEFHSVQSAIKFANDFLRDTQDSNKIQQLSSFIQNINKLEGDTVAESLDFKQKLTKRMQEHSKTPQKGMSGTDTGFLNLNRITDGWQSGDLIILGARPSMGKTAFALNSALEGSKKSEVYATIFSIEMKEEAIIDRLIATEGNINVMKMRNPNRHFNDKDWENYTKATGTLAKLNIDIRPEENNVPNMRAVVRRNIKNHPDKKHVVVIDFLTLIKSVEKKQSRHSEVEDIVLDLKQMAKDLNVPVIVIAQLSRDVERRDNKRPVLSDLRESGSIEQTADLVIFLYRDEYYNPDTKTPGVTELLIAKNRNGKVGTLNMRFAKETNTFYEYIDDTKSNTRKLI
ncbi:replicative DNA helicase [Niallia taxi]|uniref:DNA 5'-3' helicase n=1 Tax=Niallia taxi TaxID=2499688 RepID=A0A437K325_9BACI|nr:DnaB-like helicase C-terminal domain-containing protein [Niallia taxi]RVT56432.1 replicative DNA helicase [Niallia taxi]